MTEPSGPESGEPQTLVGVSFDTVFRAQELLVAAQGLAAAGRLKLNDAVIVSKDDSGRTVVRETVDPTPGSSAMSGAVWAGLFGLLLGGPVGWVAGLAVGAGAGVAAAKIIDLGISDDWAAWFRDTVEPGATIVALLVEELDTDALIAEVGRFAGANLVYANVDTATMQRIKQALGSLQAKE